MSFPYKLPRRTALREGREEPDHLHHLVHKYSLLQELLGAHTLSLFLSPSLSPFLSLILPSLSSPLSLSSSFSLSSLPLLPFSFSLLLSLPPLPPYLPLTPPLSLAVFFLSLCRSFCLCLFLSQYLPLSEPLLWTSDHIAIPNSAPPFL